MAAGGSFKQQCPSCDAMVLIKDRKLIGKKIDCTSCKFQFVVKPPVDEAEEEPKEAKAPAKGAVTSKKPAPGKPGAAPAKKKVGPRKPLEGEDDDDQGPEPPKEGRNNTMLIGIGLAVFCVLLLGVGAFFLFTDTDGPTGKGTPKTQRTIPSKVDVGPKTVELKDTGDVPTSVLPNDTQVVMNLLVNGPVETAALYTPGAFSIKLLKEKLGLDAKEVEGILVGLNLEGKKHWAFAVVRLRIKKSIDEGALKTALNLQPAPGGPINGKEYFVTPPNLWLGNLERTVVQLTPGLGDIPGEPEARPLAVHILNPTTMIVADVAPLKELLEAGGTQKALSTPAPAAGGKKSDEDRDRYLTINPALKQALDRVEGKTYNDRRLSLAWDMKAVKLDKTKDAIKKLGGDPLTTALALPLDAMAERLGEVTAGAVGLKVQGKQSAMLTLALENKEKSTADFWQETFRAFSTKAADVADLAKLVPFPVEIGGKIIGPGGDAQKWTVSSAAQGTTWQLSAEAPLGSLDNVLPARLAKATVWLRTASDMAEGPTRIFELAAATKTLAESGTLKDADGKPYQGFPPGTYPRRLGGDRFGRPYPPYERVGWMPQLLPYLGYETAFKEIHMDDPWRAPLSKNAQMGAITVPGFLDSRYPPSTWSATVRDPAGVPMTFGATHYVGVAGVGLDAADYDAKDPRCGVFGYDRITKLDDIKDGKATTILMLQVPPTYPRPWIAGGGATIMGVPEKNSVKPFVLEKILHEGKKGTYAIMADGSVRFIPETIPDDVFKAMCTINGGEKVNPDKETVLHELKAKP